MENSTGRPLAVVTGASSGIGYELAKLCAGNGFDLVLAADRPLGEAARELRGLGARVDAVETDLATVEGVDELYDAIKGRPVDALLANAGHGLGRAFLDQDFEEVRHVSEGDVVSGWQNKLQTTLANVTPAGVLAEMHRGMAEPGTGEEEAAAGEGKSAGAGGPEGR
jgi:short-subunit dehydrogenase